MVSEEAVLLAPPRFLALPRARTKVKILQSNPRRALLTFTSPVFQHRFAFELPGVAHRSSDNYFELFPGEAKIIQVDFPRPQTAGRLQRALRYRSLVDTY